MCTMVLDPGKFIKMKKSLICLYRCTSGRHMLDCFKPGALLLNPG
jgi:hypothetical protein